MSVPFGASRQSASAGRPTGSDLTTRLPLVAAGAGLLAYLLAFFDERSAALLAGIPGFCIIAVVALVVVRLLPKSPNTLYASVPLAAAGALILLQAATRGGASAMVIVILLLALIQLGAVAGALFLEAGVAGTAPVGRPQPAQGNPRQFRPQPGGWSPQQQGAPQPGPYPSPGGRPPGGPPQPPQFPPPSGPQGGWSPAQAGAAPASPPSGQSAPPPPPGGLSGTLSPPGGQPVTPPPGGPQGTQQLPHPGSLSDEP